MPRALLFPLTMMLLIATAMAMLASAMLLPMSDAAELSASGGADVVERFYDAVNEAIATGNPATLRHVVNPSFADENPLPGVAPGRAGLEAYLDSLHDADPGLQLEADVLISSGDQVMARVQVSPGAAVSPRVAAFEALRAVWSPIEVFRVADGVVVGRWSHTDGLMLAQCLAEQTLALPIPTPRVVSLMRVAQVPGTRWDAPRVAGPRLLFVEAGVLEVQAVLAPAGDGAQSQLPGSMASDNRRDDAPQRTHRVSLAAGMSWQAPAGVSMSSTSTGSTEAHLLVVTFSEPKIPNGTFPEPEAGTLPSGVTAQVLAGDLATNLGTGAVTVTLEQIAVAPDAGLNLWSTEGPILLAVQTGQLETTTRGTSWVRRSRDGISVATRASTQTTDNGMFLQPGGMVALRNGEQHPARALVVTIQPTGAARSPSPIHAGTTLPSTKGGELR